MVLKFIKSIFLKTQSFLGDKIRKLFSKDIDENTLEELESLLYSADFGSKMSVSLVEDVKEKFRKNPKIGADEILNYLKSKISSNLQKYSPIISTEKKPTVILVVGVNGNGKTTTCAKLAAYYKREGKKVLLAACDTFRAAAINQLQAWSERIGVDLIKAQHGSDPASIAYDSISAALARDTDVLIIDTAGRLQTKTHLMQELEKICRVLKKQSESAPSETLLVIDATIGQNAIEQARTFNQYTPLTGLVLTKLDGSAKGGIVVPIQDELNIPIKFIGVGEQVDDLKAFDPQIFANELFQ